MRTIKTYFFIAFLLFTCNILYGQDDQIYEEVAVPAEYEGGMGKFYKWAIQELKYPKDALESRVEGKVYVKFIIDEKGQVIDDSIEVVRGLNESCNNEAIRILSACSTWTPARTHKNKKKGHNVKQRMVLPIPFKLPNN
ncbi:energy transducer TonB [Flammeovirga sp. SubArs3]|uniref:energy transducer TonB n=1 Tax=Flammeovirga sp. SubArs3 TaxID=2995316 RepID=UPI00248BD7E8|nr:energy transducer TonB [Flammeovirga sp. SubArs3]